jgi:hypothetical protein
MCGCTNKKYMLYSHRLNLIFQLTETILQTLLQKQFEMIQTFFLTDIQTDTDIRLRKIASVD